MTILSARCPTYDTTSDSWQVEVENFGLSMSEETKLRIISGGEILAETFVPPIGSYGNSTVAASTIKSYMASREYFTIFAYHKPQIANETIS